MNSLSDSVPTGGEIALSGTGGNGPSPPTMIPPPVAPRPGDKGGMMHAVLGIALTVIALIATLLSTKYQNKKQSPFETHGFFMILGILTLCVMVLAYLTILYIKSHSRTSLRDRFSPIHYMVLKVLFCGSGILAPVSFLIPLCIPPNLNGLGYAIVVVLFLIVAGHNVYHYKMTNQTQVCPFESTEEAPGVVDGVV